MGNGAGRIGLIAAVAGFSLAAVAADFDVRVFGAKGDGLAKDTDAIQRSIEACAKAGGGRVVLTNGVFLTAPFQLRSDVELHIAADWCRRHGDTNRFAEIR